MRVFLKMVLFSALFYYFIGNAFAGATFSICQSGLSKCLHDTSAKWIDAISKVDYATESVKLIPYKGIIIQSDGAFKNLTFYLKGYKGVGKYPLVGTESTSWSRSTNAVYGDDIANAPHWISTRKPEGSIVEVTSDKDGLLSGKYKITVYLDGDVTNRPVRFTGEFKDIPKITNPAENQ